MRSFGGRKIEIYTSTCEKIPYGRQDDSRDNYSHSSSIMDNSEGIWKLNLIWYNQAKYYCQMKEDPAFFKDFDWLNVELKMKKEPTCKPYQEKYTYITEEEMKKIETNIREKWGDI